MKINFCTIIFIIIFYSINANADETFEQWKNRFKNYAIKEGISLKILNKYIDQSVFLPDVIKYDRFQPIF